MAYVKVGQRHSHFLRSVPLLAPTAGKKKKPQGVAALRLLEKIEKVRLKFDSFGFFQGRRHCSRALASDLIKCVFHGFRGGISCGGEFADEEEFGPFEHFFFAGRKRLGTA